eukprot:1159465-Pelagomonas_calceolata.AAC.4
MASCIFEKRMGSAPWISEVVPHQFAVSSPADKGRKPELIIHPVKAAKCKGSIQGDDYKVQARYGMRLTRNRSSISFIHVAPYTCCKQPNPMAFREKLFVAASRAAKEGQQHGLPPNLHADAKLNLSKILEKRRNTFWGETPILFRSRKYKFGGEVRDE